MRKPKIGTTKKELPEALEKINKEGMLNSLIRCCKKGMFHDWESDLVCPKMQLVEALGKYPECKEIMDDVINGCYDEPHKNSNR